MRQIIFASLLFVTALAACGDDGGKGAADARMIGSDAPVVCAAEAAYGAATPADPYADRDLDVNPESLIYNGSMNMDYDDVTIELFKGFGVFAETEIVPTTVQLTGEEAAFDTCGACVLIYANWNRETEEADMIYLAIGGTLNITQVTPNIQGNILNASFVHVDIDDEDVSTASPDNCASSIGSFAFDTVVMTMPPAAAFAPGQKHKRVPHRRR